MTQRRAGSAPPSVRDDDGPADDEEAPRLDDAAGAEAVRADTTPSVGSEGCARVTAASGLRQGQDLTDVRPSAVRSAAVHGARHILPEKNLRRAASIEGCRRRSVMLFLHGRTAKLKRPVASVECGGRRMMGNASDGRTSPIGAKAARAAVTLSAPRDIAASRAAEAAVGAAWPCGARARGSGRTAAGGPLADRPAALHRRSTRLRKQRDGRRAGGKANAAPTC